MKILTTPEAKQLMESKQRSHVSFYLGEVQKLEEGQVLFISFAEWSKKSHPTAFTGVWNKRHGLDLWCESVEDGYLIGKGDKPK